MNTQNIAQILGSNGGNKTLKKYGKEHFVEMGIKSSLAKKRLKKLKKPVDKISI